MRVPITQVDAFASKPFGGNSAAVMPLDAWPADELLIAIAMENNLSETAYLLPTTGDADFELRWCTPTREVGMCGHATLAAGHVVLSGDPRREIVRFRTRKAGILTVTRAESGYALDLPAVTTAETTNAPLLAALGLPPETPIFVSQGAADPAHIILLDDEAAVCATAPDFAALAKIDTMAIVTAPGSTAEIASRVFVSAWGIDEDPVTGSAHAALTPFWAARLGRERFTAFQASARGGHLGCTLDGARARLSGACVTVMEGSFFL